MNNINDGGPAFPASTPMRTTVLGVPTEFPTQQGMSLRDYFGGVALGATMQQWAFCSPEGREQCAEECYKMADAMLFERAKKGGSS